MVVRDPPGRRGKAGLIRGGCARLPPVARTYRDIAAADGEPVPDVVVSERGRVTGQVLLVDARSRSRR